LGFDDDETSKSSYEIEQMVRNRVGEPGGWQEVVEEQPQLAWMGTSGDGKRKLGEYGVDEENGEHFRFQHRDKRPVKDVWDDEDWDPRRALEGLRMRVKEERRFAERNGSSQVEASASMLAEAEPAGGLKREEWTGRLELRLDGETVKGKEKEVRDGLMYVPNGGGWVKAEPVTNGAADTGSAGREAEDFVGGQTNGDVRAELLEPPVGKASGIDEEPPPDVKPDLTADPQLASKPNVESAPIPNSLFKKRRPAPAARRK